MLLIEYSKCSTCKKAKKFLIENNIEFEIRDIKEKNPTKEELIKFHKKSDLYINKFFNTSGLVYRERKLKDKLPNMTYEEKIEELASDGMLVKRPILVMEDKVLVGFKEKEWEEVLN